MVEQSLSALLEILSSSSVGMDALTSQVAIFGVLQNAHACATTGGELGLNMCECALLDWLSRPLTKRKLRR